MLALTVAQAAEFCIGFVRLAPFIESIRAGAIDGNEAEAQYHQSLFIGNTSFVLVSLSFSL